MIEREKQTFIEPQVTIIELSSSSIITDSGKSGFDVIVDFNDDGILG